MVLEAPGHPLRLSERAIPEPRPDEVLVRVRACGVCRTDLHIVDGELAHPALPLVPGHEIVGVVERAGARSGHAAGERVGIPWLAETCGRCDYCRRGAENLCTAARFTGYTRDGGYADYALATGAFAFPLPARYGDLAAAPLLCAGLIGYRALALADRLLGRRADRLGLYGFGAAAHILAQVARHQGRDVYALTRAGDAPAQALARRLGAIWAGDAQTMPPARLDAALLFAPVGGLVPRALEAVDKGGAVVCAGIHMSDIPTFPYRLLWEERALRSVANLTRADAQAFLTLAADLPIETETIPYPLEAANRALDDLRAGRFAGAAVLDLR